MPVDRSRKVSPRNARLFGQRGQRNVGTQVGFRRQKVLRRAVADLSHLFAAQRRNCTVVGRFRLRPDEYRRMGDGIIYQKAHRDDVQYLNQPRIRTGPNHVTSHYDYEQGGEQRHQFRYPLFLHPFGIGHAVTDLPPAAVEETENHREVGDHLHDDHERIDVADPCIVARHFVNDGGHALPLGDGQTKDQTHCRRQEMEQLPRAEPEVGIEVLAREEPQQRQQQHIDRIADREHEERQVVPAQHPAHVVEIDRDVRHDDDGGRKPVLPAKAGRCQQDYSKQYQNRNASGIDGQYDLRVLHLLVRYRKNKIFGNTCQIIGFQRVGRNNRSLGESSQDHNSEFVPLAKFRLYLNESLTDVDIIFPTPVSTTLLLPDRG